MWFGYLVIVRKVGNYIESYPATRYISMKKVKSVLRPRGFPVNVPGSHLQKVRCGAERRGLAVVKAELWITSVRVPKKKRVDTKDSKHHRYLDGLSL